MRFGILTVFIDRDKLSIQRIEIDFPFVQMRSRKWRFSRFQLMYALFIGFASFLDDSWLRIKKCRLTADSQILLVISVLLTGTMIDVVSLGNRLALFDFAIPLLEIGFRWNEGKTCLFDIAIHIYTLFSSKSSIFSFSRYSNIHLRLVWFFVSLCHFSHPDQYIVFIFLQKNLNVLLRAKDDQQKTS